MKVKRLLKQIANSADSDKSQSMQDFLPAFGAGAGIFTVFWILGFAWSSAKKAMNDSVID